MDGLLISLHQGLGDFIICNRIVRQRCEVERLVVIPVKYHNIPSVAHMFSDLNNLVIRPVEDDEELLFFSQQIWDGRRLGLGCFGSGFDGQHWDESFFKQAGIPFKERWSKWVCPRDKTLEDATFGHHEDLIEDAESTKRSWAFVHGDASRGLIPDKFPQLMPVATIRPSAHLSPVIFAWWKVIEQAPIIHCIPSSFAHFIDSINLPRNPKLYLHRYVRANEPLAVFKKDWTILE